MARLNCYELLPIQVRFCGFCLTNFPEDTMINTIQKGWEEEEYGVVPDREDCSAAGRRSQGMRAEGSFGAGILNMCGRAGTVCRFTQELMQE